MHSLVPFVLVASLLSTSVLSNEVKTLKNCEEIENLVGQDDAEFHYLSGYSKGEMITTNLTIEQGSKAKTVGISLDHSQTKQ